MDVKELHNGAVILCSKNYYKNEVQSEHYNDMANINQLRNLIIALGLGDDSKTVHTFKHEHPYMVTICIILNVPLKCSHTTVRGSLQKSSWICN